MAAGKKPFGVFLRPSLGVELMRGCDAYIGQANSTVKTSTCVNCLCFRR